MPALAPTASSSATSPRASDANPAPTRFRNELERARTKRREAEAMAFVRPADAPSSDARVQMVVEWLQQREAATDEADGAYRAAREHATPTEQVLVERERGELYWELFDAKLRSTLVIFPGITQASAERVAALRANVAKRFQHDASKARDRFVACLVLSSQLGLKNTDSARCEEQIRVIDVLSEPEKKRDPALEEWRFARLEDVPRLRQPVARGPGCLLSGSAHTSSWTRLYTAATGTDYNLVLEDFDVAALELPAKRGERARLSIDYPFRASGYIDLDAGVVETDGRLDILPGHLWLDPHSTVRAFGVDSGQVSIEREGNAKSEPAVALRVPCGQLTLAREASVPAGEVKGETSQLSGVVPLLGAPGGKRIAQLDSDSGVNVRVLGRQPGWARVTTADAGVSFATPYEFDAWVADRFAPVGKEGFGIAVLAFTGRAPTHVTTGLVPLRLAPDPKAVVVAELAPGVSLLAGAEQGSMRRVRFNQAHGHNEGNDFWVRREDLSSRAAPAPGKEEHPSGKASGSR